MIERNGTNGDATDVLASIVNGSNGHSTSEQVLLVLKAVHDANMEPVDATSWVGEQEDQEVIIRVIELLCDEELLTGPLEQIVLTLKGLRTLKAASTKDQRVALFLGSGSRVLDVHHPTALLISILRVHLEDE